MATGPAGSTDAVAAQSNAVQMANRAVQAKGGSLQAKDGNGAEGVHQTAQAERRCQMG